MTSPAERANAELIERFYEAFARRDHATMAASYAPDARFSDAVFTDLRGDEIGMMWRMLCTQGRDLEIEHDGVEADEDSGRARWRADYTFSTGRPVHNEIEAAFRFRDGLIVEHRDRFGFWRWSRQALGLPGLLLGWTPLLRAAVRRQAARRLANFLETEKGR